MKKALAILMGAVMACTLSAQVPALAAETPSAPDAAQEEQAVAVTAQISALNYIDKYGNVFLNMTIDDFLAAGFEYGDVVDVAFLGQTCALPVCSNYSDVDAGQPALTARARDGYIKLAVNNGNFAEDHGIATKTTNEDKTYVWTLNEGVELPVTVSISMREKAGYYAEYVMRNISYTDARENYPNLSDEQFANFRNVATTGMGKNVLYRSASPVNPAHNRNTYADAATRNAGVTVIMNLSDDEASVQEYEGFADSYYATTKYIALNMGVDATDASFKASLGEGLRFFVKNPGVYEIHCNEGKDRVGTVCAILECFMGASASEVVADYMVSYYNYYGITADDDRYDVIANSNVVKNLKSVFDVDDIYSADLKACATRYIEETGLTKQEINSLRNNLQGKDCTKHEASFAPRKAGKIGFACHKGPKAKGCAFKFFVKPKGTAGCRQAPGIMECGPRQAWGPASFSSRPQVRYLPDPARK